MFDPGLHLRGRGGALMPPKLARQHLHVRISIELDPADGVPGTLSLANRPSCTACRSALDHTGRLARSEHAAACNSGLRAPRRAATFCPMAASSYGCSAERAALAIEASSPGPIKLKRTL